MHRLALFAIALLAALAVAAPAFAADSMQPGATTLLSRSDGFGPLPAQADGSSWLSPHATSADGRFTVFLSGANDLGATDDQQHVYVRDDQTGAVTLLDRAGPGGPVAADRSDWATISADGTHACFTSYASLVPNAGEHHVYVADIATGTIVLADRSTGGTVGNNAAQNCVLDADGNTVAFVSRATNLVAGVTSGTHVYVRHLDTSTTQLVDSYQGTAGDSSADSPSIDDAGTTVAFASGATNLNGPGGDTNSTYDVYVRVLSAAQPVLASRATGGAGAIGNGASGEPSLSGDGLLVAFTSSASNLGDGDGDTTRDVHVRNVIAASTTLVSRAEGAGGAKGDRTSQSPAIAGDGSAVAFLSESGNLGIDPGVNGDQEHNEVPFLRTLSGAHTTALGRATGASGAVSQVGFGSVSLDQHATNAVFDTSSATLDPLAGGAFEEVFERHLTGDFATRLISRPADASGRPAQIGHMEPSRQAVSADGRFAVFTAVASFDGAPAGVPEAFLRDTLLGTTRLISRADGAGGVPADREVGRAVISADGTKVAFNTSATNLSGPTDGVNRQVYVRDLAANTTTLASTGPSGPGNRTSEYASLNQDGSRVAFVSGASNLVAGDSNDDYDVFVRDLKAGTTTAVNVTAGGGLSAVGARDPMLSADGTRVGFTSYAKDLLDGVADGKNHLYVRDLAATTTTLVDRAADGSPASSSTDRVSMSADGNRFLFSSASALTSDDANASADAFLRDVAAGTTTLVGLGPNGEHASAEVFPEAISPDGTKVGYTTYGNAFGNGNSNAGWVRDLATGATSIVALRDGSQTPAQSSPQYMSMSANGNCVVFEDSDGALASPSYAGDDISQLWMHTLAGECPVHAPDTAITSGPDGRSKVREAYSVFAYKADESGATFRCSLDSAAPQACGDTFHTGRLRDGVHRFAVVATDRAGNTDPTPALVTFTVGVPPRITQLRLVHGRLVFKLSEKAKVRVVLSRAGKAHSAAVGRLTLRRSLKAGTRRIALPVARLKPGHYHATITASDAGGNRSVPKRKSLDVRK